MKRTGIVRRIDELGRIVLPIELRRSMGIDVKDAVEIYVDGDHIVLRKASETCMFCGNEDSVISFKGKSICTDCLEEIKVIK